MMLKVYHLVKKIYLKNFIFQSRENKEGVKAERQ